MNRAPFINTLIKFVKFYMVKKTGKLSKEVWQTLPTVNDEYRWRVLKPDGKW